MSHDTNGNDFEPITAAAITLSQAPNQAPGTDNADSTESASSPQRWLYGAIGIALVCLLGLLFATLYPATINPTGQDLPTTKPISTASEIPASIESPFQIAQLAAARRTSQDILARVLDKQQALETINVRQWAGEQYQQVLSAAIEGDRLYRERDFKRAIAHYSHAEALLEQLETGREARITQQLSQAANAINQGHSAVAQQLFAQVLLMAPKHPQVLQGQQRCITLAEVFAATERGAALQLAGDYRSALAAYHQALALDPLFTAAINGRQESAKLQQDELYQAAINQGYQHLLSAQFSTARQHFQRALSIAPQSPVAQSALAQVDNEIAQQAIALLLKRAHGAESKEQWQTALDIYQDVLDRDAAITVAVVGKIRSAARQQLDASLATFIHQPLRLASAAVYRAAQQSLRDAQQISAAGPHLKRQISALRQVLHQAQQRQTVVLRSDNLTRVSIFKLGEFSPFTEKTLQLKPGKYIAEGIRSGYRDVRVEFTVLGADTAPVVVQCGETI